MKNLFEHTSAKWVRYSDYEYKEKDGTLYLLPTEDAMPSVYDPMKDPETLVLKMTEIGQMCFKSGTPDEEIQAAIREFACQYGLLGLMTALPTTAKFIDYEKVYLPKNEFIRAESMDTFEYMEHFFPFKKPDFGKTATGYTWSETDNMMSALMLAFIGNGLSSEALSETMELLDGVDFSVNVISKSGTTTEPAVAFRFFQRMLEEKYGKAEAAKRIYATTDRARGALKSLADENGYETFVVADDILRGAC